MHYNNNNQKKKTSTAYGRHSTESFFSSFAVRIKSTVVKYFVKPIMVITIKVCKYESKLIGNKAHNYLKFLKTSQLNPSKICVDV